MQKRWLEIENLDPPQALVEAIGGHPLTVEILTKRGILDPQTALAFLDPAYYIPTPAEELPGLSTAVERINRAVEQGETILVWGDFDVDGQTSTTLLSEALHGLGAQVVYHIPVRESEGHGIQPEVLEALLSPEPPELHPFPPQAGTTTVSSLPHPSLLLTCDTGIAEFEAVHTAHKLGLDVIITDHHELPGELPGAEAILNPHLLPEGHHLSTLPGVGVAHKLVEGLYQSRSRYGASDSHLDLVALGIVADVAEQTGDTRYLLQRGLEVLRENKRPGMAALLRIADISPGNLDESHIGFAIAPRLNALGRLGDANAVVEFFTTEDPERAEYLAAKLDNLNIERRMLTERVFRGALDIIKTQPELQDYSALVLAQPGWHPGVVGIVASRLVERFGKPTILLSINEDGIAHGSARSVEGLNLVKAIEQQSDLLLDFGGHAGAAGMRLEVNAIAEFRSRLSRTVKGMTVDRDLRPSLTLDAFLPLGEVTLDLVDDLNRLGPFGAGNPPITIASPDVRLVSETRVGRQSEHLRLVVEDEDGHIQQVLWWHGAEEPKPDKESRFDLAYHPSSRTFQGVKQLQLEWLDFRAHEEYPDSLRHAISRFEIIDYRDHHDPFRLLYALREREIIQVWAEGAGKKTVDGSTRVELQKGESLAIWTAPPNYHILADVIERVKPKTIYVFALLPELDIPGEFLKRLLGLLKTVINRKGGIVSLGTLAAEMAQTEDTVIIGLRQLQVRGMLSLDITKNSEDSATGEVFASLAWRPGNKEDSLNEINSILISLLTETAAYRNYFRSADLHALIQ